MQWLSSAIGKKNDTIMKEVRGIGRDIYPSDRQTQYNSKDLSVIPIK